MINSINIDDINDLYVAVWEEKLIFNFGIMKQRSKSKNFKKRKIDILYFASCGGHLDQVLKIAKSLQNYKYHF